MADDAALRYADEFARLSRALNQRDSLSTMERIVEAAVESIDACDWCAVTVWHRDGRVETAASTSAEAALADDLQYKLDEGPCLEAIWRLGVFLIENLSDERRWPEWTPQAAQLGIGSVLSVKIDTPGARSEAALNLYSGTPFAFDHTDVALAGIFARHAAAALEGARQQDQLRAAVRSRQVIGVAEGILMQRFGLTLDQSFELLRRYSQTFNVKLRVLAENLVAAGGIRESTEIGVEAALEQSFGLEGTNTPSLTAAPEQLTGERENHPVVGRIPRTPEPDRKR